MQACISIHPNSQHSLDQDDRLVTVGMAIIAGETKPNIIWCLEQLKAAGLSMPDFSRWWEGRMAHFMDRGAGMGAIYEVGLDDHWEMYVSKKKGREEMKDEWMDGWITDNHDHDTARFLVEPQHIHSWCLLHLSWNTAKNDPDKLYKHDNHFHVLKALAKSRNFDEYEVKKQRFINSVGGYGM